MNYNIPFTNNALIKYGLVCEVS